MMQSSYGIGGGNDDEDMFAPNPFRDPTQQSQQSFAAPPQQQQAFAPPQQQQQFMPQQQQQQFVPQQNAFAPQQGFGQPTPNQFAPNNFAPQQQVDPNSGMTGSFAMPPPQQQQPVQYLSGTMDQNGNSNNNTTYGSNDSTTPTTSSFLSMRFCTACLRLETYQAYFDMDTADILSRLKASLLFFHQPDYFRVDTLGDDRNVTQPEGNQGAPPAADTPILRKGPDLYGPLWIACTLVFTLAVTSNLLIYFDHWNHMPNKPSGGSPGINGTAPTEDEKQIEAMEYDLTHLIHAVSVVFTFSIGLPTFFYLATVCLGMARVPWVMWICCYGYSLMPYVAVTALLWMPWWSLLQWLLLAGATAASGLLVLRNLSNPLLQQDSDGGGGRAAPFILALPVTHFIFMCVLKLTFYDP